MSKWVIPEDWKGQTSYIIGGGPSVTPEMVEQLRVAKAKTIAVNMSYLAAPWADYLFFADLRWWDREVAERYDYLFKWSGRIVTTSPHVEQQVLAADQDRALKQLPDVHLVGRIVPHDIKTGMSFVSNTVSMERTSLQGALNLCYHLGSRRIVLLGADNRDAPNGRIHWHNEYPWTRFNDSWDIKQKQMGYGAAALKAANCEVINCSPVSTLPFWPIRPLDEVLKEG